jgi:hypothetical protein
VSDTIVDDIKLLNRHLAPPGIEPRHPLIARKDRVCLAALDPTPNIKLSDTAVSTGKQHDSASSWMHPGDAIPDGAFCLLRADEHTLQLVTDPTGSRTIWYLLANDYFVASTSQRAIVALARSFSLSMHASAWMLSTGALGPGYSWDERIRMVPPNSILSLNMDSWALTESIDMYEYSAEEHSEDHFKGCLADALDRVFSEIGEYAPDWLVPLSGGVDSRGVMLWLPDPRRFEYVTWGSPGAINGSKTDANVAARLAQKHGLRHRHVPLKENIENPETFFAKFLASGEGRISHISGYLDEFAFWEGLHESGCPGVIRGDQVFGGPVVRRPIQVLQLEKLCTLSDMPNPFGTLGRHFPEQHLPPHLHRRAGETLDAWRCRTELHFRAPVVRAALNTLKYAYTDVVSPLQFRPILEVIVRMPDALRTNKRLFAELVSGREREIPFATRIATTSASEVVVEKATRDFLMDGISTLDSEVYLPAEALRAIRSITAGIATPNGNEGRRSSSRSLASRARIRFEKYFGGARITPPQLLLRSFLAIAASRMLANDAYLLTGKSRDAAAMDAFVDAASA